MLKGWNKINIIEIHIVQINYTPLIHYFPFMLILGLKTFVNLILMFFYLNKI